MLLQDLSPDHLDAPYAGAAQLAFPQRARGNQFLGLDVRLQLGRKPEAVQGGSGNGDPVVSKHGQVVDVVKVTVGPAVETCPEI